MAKWKVLTESVVCFVLLYLNTVRSISNHPVILVVSYDGFRYDYIDKNITPTLKRLKYSGSYVDYMRNVFVTKTFPNHHSIATGVYPEVHGILANEVYDPVYNKVLNYSKELGYEFWHFNNAVIPIWTLNQKAGEGRHSGVMMWPGGGDEIYLNTTLTYAQAYAPSIPFTKRIDTVLSWIEDPEKPANLVFMYFEEPDKTAHVYGPDSPEVRDAISKMDNLTAYLLQQLEEKNLTKSVNLFLLSDHGFETVVPSRIINVTDFIPHELNYTVLGTSPALHIIPKPGDEDGIYEALKNASQENGHFSVYRKSELLDRWHYKKNRRSPPIFVLAEESYAFDDLYFYVEEYENKTHKKISDNTTFGVHGYDNDEKNMHPYFIAFGPLIKKEYKLDPFDSVDLYSLFCYMLDLDAPNTNGTLDNVKYLLANEPDPSLKYILGGVVVAALSIAAAAIVTICLLRHRIRKSDPLGNSSYRDVRQMISRLKRNFMV